MIFWLVTTPEGLALVVELMATVSVLNQRSPS